MGRESSTSRREVGGDRTRASGLLHDMGNAIGALRLRLRVLMRDEGCSKSQQPNLLAMERILEHLVELNRRLLRPEAGLWRRRDQVADVERVLYRAIELAGTIAGRGSSQRVVRFVLPERALPAVAASEHELARVFANLFANARQAMPGGGEIRVGARRRGRRLVLQVRDEGPGIPAPVQAHLFEPGFTTKGQNGRGLGLATARALVEGAGGSIRLRPPRRSLGACFELELPLVEALPEARAARRPPRSAGPRRQPPARWPERPEAG